VTLEELKSAEQIVKQKNQDTGKSKINNSIQVETNNNSTNNIGTTQVSKILQFLIFSSFYIELLFLNRLQLN